MVNRTAVVRSDPGWRRTAHAVPLDLIDLDGDGDYDEMLPIDFGGMPRVHDGDMTEIVDAGAHEYQGGPPPMCAGDFNGDGAREYFDINYLIAALGGQQEWVAHYRAGHDGAPPPCRYAWNCDVNQDGSVDYFDINPFLEILGQPCE